jgi:predicted porin
MKKSVVALAVLGAFTSVAFAQSSVTLYGRIDNNMTWQNPGNEATIKGGAQKGRAAMKINDGGVNGMGASRLGVKGTEDLGSGLKAYFVLEAQVSADTGDAGSKSTQTSSTSFFNREAYVALGSSSYGDVRLGRLETITRETNRRVNDVSSENELSIAETLDNYNNGTERKQTRPLFQNFGTRVDNAISYRSPNFGGLQGFVTVGLSENYKLSTTTYAGSPLVATTKDTHGLEYRGLGAIYNLGPFNAAVSYEELASNQVRGGSFDNTVTVGANYDFGMAVLYVAYQNSSEVAQDALSGSNSLSFSSTNGATSEDSKGADHEAFNLGVKVPVGNFTFKAQYTESNISGLRTDQYAIRGGQLKQYKYGGLVSYAFSKRTSVYAVASTRGGDGDQYFQRKNEYAIGIGHNF